MTVKGKASRRPRPWPGMRVRIRKTSKLFPGKDAVIAYVGNSGVSVYLTDDEFYDCVPLNNDEWETP